MSERARLTYPEQGATQEAFVSGAPLPRGYRHLHLEVPLPGRAVTSAGPDLLSWAAHRRARVRVDAGGAAQPGMDVATYLGVGLLAVRAPCRVLWVRREVGLHAFGYGTLPGHPFAGEEAFGVVDDGHGGGTLVVLAFSRPRTLLARLAGPVAPLLQRAYLRLLARALAKRRGNGSTRVTTPGSGR